MAELDVEDVERITAMDLALVQRRLDALRSLPIPAGTADGHATELMRGRSAAELTPAERHWLAVTCWTWRRRLARGTAPRINPSDPLSPDMLARQLGLTPTLALARSAGQSA